MSDPAAAEALLASGWTHAAGRWRSPSGQLLSTISSATVPSFTFAYNAMDQDMQGLRRQRLVEPALTHHWLSATRSCCAAGGTVVDVGANFGWYTLLSLALGCAVVAVEPVPAWREVLTLGVALNQGFASRLTLVAAVAYPERGTFTVWAPDPRSASKVQMGMTALQGSVGMPKRIQGALPLNVSSVQLDELRSDGVLLGERSDVCMLKADVEGYEPHVLSTAQRLLAHKVPVLQLEITRRVTHLTIPGTDRWGRHGRIRSQANDGTCANVKMLQSSRSAASLWQPHSERGVEPNRSGRFAALTGCQGVPPTRERCFLAARAGCGAATNSRHAFLRH